MNIWRAMPPVLAAALLAGCLSEPGPQTTPAFLDEDGTIDQHEAMATSTLDSATIATRKVAHFEQLLVGLPGVQVIGSGASLSVRIRGRGTLYGNTEPLYVLDGIALPPGNTAALRNINPADVAEIEVLRDGASTARWGVRGANGVILIRTKRGP